MTKTAIKKLEEEAFKSIDYIFLQVLVVKKNNNKKIAILHCPVLARVHREK